MTTSITKQTSDRLEHMIKEANTHFDKASEYVLNIYNWAVEKEGWPKDQAIQLLVNRIPFLSKATVYKCLPEEAKNPLSYQISEAKAKAKAKQASSLTVERLPASTAIAITDQGQEQVNIPPIDQPIIEGQTATKEDIENDFEKQKTAMSTRFIILPFTKGMIEFLHLVEMDDIGLKIYIDENLKYDNKLETLVEKR